MNKMGATVEITAPLIQNHIRKAFECLSPLLSFANAPAVTFFTKRLWRTHVPAEIQREIQTIDDINDAVEIYWKHLDLEQSDVIPNDRFKHFRKFLSNVRRHHLDNFEDVWITPEKFKQILDAHHRITLPIEGFMSQKKNHEVRIAADLIANMCASMPTKEALGVIDAGDGKGYLSTRLSLEHNIKVLGVDCNPTNTLGAQIRSKKLERRWDGMKIRANKVATNQPIEKQTRNKRKATGKQNTEPKVTPHINENYKNATHFITPQTDFIKLFSEHFDISTDDVPDLCLTGLHTCGNLAPSCLRIYSENAQIEAMCNIGCCYHLLTEQFSEFVYEKIRRERSPDSKMRHTCEQLEEPLENTYGFPMSQYLIERKTKLGRNARMLALQPVHRTVDKKEWPSNKMFFRALLEVLIQRKCPEYLDRVEVGRMRKCETFVEYARTASKRNPVLNFDDITDDQLNQLYDEFSGEQRFLDIYHLMRITVATIVENVLMLDRFLYLKELESGGDISYLVRFFDPVVSPRTYGLIAIKKFEQT